MAANVPDPMESEREREHPLLTSAPKIDHRFLTNIFKVKTCPFDDCGDPAKCLFKHAGEQGRRDPSRFLYGPSPCVSYCRNGGSCPQGDTCRFAHGLLEFSFHPQHFIRIGALKLDLEAYEGIAAVLPCERTAIQLILELNSIGQICGYKRNGILLLDPSYNKAGNEMAIARAARDAMSKHGDDLPKTTAGSTYSYKNPFHVVWTKSSVVLRDFAVTSPVGSRLEWAVDASRMAGGFLDDDDMVEPDDLKLDSAASYHVVGEKTLLQGYQSLVCPWSIRVADGYPLEVVGIGSITTKRFIIPNVYRVKELKGNLISVSQLDRDHGLFTGFHSGICKVLKRDGEQVGGGFMQANGIYKLSFLEVPEADCAYENA